MRKSIARGFSLIEVLVIITIISVLAAVALPAMFGDNAQREIDSKREKAYSALSEAIELQNIKTQSLSVNSRDRAKYPTLASYFAEALNASSYDNVNNTLTTIDGMVFEFSESGYCTQARNTDNSSIAQVSTCSVIVDVNGPNRGANYIPQEGDDPDDSLRQDKFEFMIYDKEIAFVNNGIDMDSPSGENCDSGYHKDAYGACVPNQEDCPAGMHRDSNGICVVDQVVCPDGQHREHGVCVADETECPEGEHLENGMCVADETTCPEGQHLENGVCVLDEITCPSGQHLEDGVCVADELVCPTGQHVEDGICVADIVNCPAGHHDEGGICVPDVTCPDGQHEENGACVPDESGCPEGQHKNLWGVCVVDETNCPEGQHKNFLGFCVPDDEENLGCPDGQTRNIWGACEPIDDGCPEGFHRDESTGTCVPDEGAGEITADDCTEDEFFEGGICIPNGYITIYSAQDLQNINNNLRGNYILMNDIDLSSLGTLSRALITGRFNGVLDGNGHEISNLTISTTINRRAGLIARTHDATIENLSLTSVNIDVPYGDEVGALVGLNDIHSTITNCSSSGSVKGDDHVGGLVGRNDNSSTITKSYSTVSVSGDSYIAGLVGFNNTGSTVTNSYASGDVSGDYGAGGLVGYNRGDISYCYSTGSVMGVYALRSYVGGFVGINNGGSIDNTNYWDTQTANQERGAAWGGNIFYAQGKSTSQMQSASTFEGWDADIWNLQDGGYMTLKNVEPETN